MSSVGDACRAGATNDAVAAEGAGCAHCSNVASAASPRRSAPTTARRCHIARGPETCGTAITLVCTIALICSPAVAEQSQEARIGLLEAQLRALTARVAALEAGAAGGDASMGGITWQLGPGIDGRPLRISHKALDLDKGSIELLVEITGPLPDAAGWRAGGPAPVAVTLRAPDGSEHEQPMTLMRGARLDPGGHLHLAAELDPAQAAGATLLRIHRIATP